MQIGVVREIKDRENRVALTPEGTRKLTTAGHGISVETAAGLGSGFSDQEYSAEGAEIVTASQAWDSELIVKVKEPMAPEYRYLQGQMVFTYFHLAGVPKALTDTLLESGTTAIAYETLEDENGRLPLLAPMSAVAGNMATLMGSYYLARFNGGKGVQLGTVLAQRHGKVVIIGDGVVGRHAARVADCMGADVYIAGLVPERETILKKEISGSIHYFPSNAENIAAHVRDADVVVGAVLRHGARAPYVVTEAMVKTMQKGSVIVDVSIDQGGCVETSRPTSHSDPVFEAHGIIHYCVTNMPGAYPRTSTLALTEATFPYVLRLADKGLESLIDHPGFAKAVNTYKGYVTCKPVAEQMGMIDRFREFEELLGA
ncbi:MAG: alanine dehydrogenase [Pseudomonadota bacterium]